MLPLWRAPTNALAVDDDAVAQKPASTVATHFGLYLLDGAWEVQDETDKTRIFPSTGLYGAVK